MIDFNSSTMDRSDMILFSPSSMLILLNLNLIKSADMINRVWIPLMTIAAKKSAIRIGKVESKN